MEGKMVQDLESKVGINVCINFVNNIIVVNDYKECYVYLFLEMKANHNG